MNKKIYSIYKYLPKYIYRIISTIKKTNIGGTQLLDKAPPPCDYVRPIGLLPTEPEQLLEMTKLVPRPGWQVWGSVCSYIVDCLGNHGVHCWRGHTIIVSSSLED
jgi:hypothetical protein